MRVHDTQGEIETHRRVPERSLAEPEGSTAFPAHLDPESILQLQRVVGNVGVGALLDDEQRTDAAPSEPHPSTVHDVVRSGNGSPLDAQTLDAMEGALGQDFSSVRVHTGAKADESARSVRARAYTTGENVVFAAGNYQPATESGQKTLAHELTHVVQQRKGPVEGTPVGGGVQVSDPADRFEREADRVGDAVITGAQSENSRGAAASASAVQRQASPEDEMQEDAVQLLALQRQASSEEEVAEDEMA
ncbi:MAG: eCIS core domain-containing protein [Gaiellaceae bacterium]